MILNIERVKKYECNIIKVGDRWYICTFAVYVPHDGNGWTYTTPTLKYSVTDSQHGWYVLRGRGCGYGIEIMGYRQSITVEYL